MGALLQPAAERAAVPRPQRLHVWGAAVFALLGFAYCFITPPFRGPDERNHFLRSYQVSELRLFGERLPDGFSGGDLPLALSEMSAALGHHQDNRVTEAQLQAAREIKLDPARRGPTEFSNTVLYSPVVYVPAAVSIGIGRGLGLAPLQLLYVARAANVIACCLVIGFALKGLGYARWPAVLTVGLPMAVSQGALVTADAMTFAISFFWIAKVAELGVARSSPLSRKSVATLVIGALLLSQLRPPYPMLGLLVCAILPRTLGRTRWAVLAISASVLLAAAVPAIAWNASARPLFVPEKGYDMAARAAEVKADPGAFFRAAKRDVVRRGADRWSQTVGRFGWLNIPLPSALTTAYAAALLLSCCVASSHLPRPFAWQRLTFLAIGIIGITAVQLLLFLTYNVGWVQGRYFIPFVMVLAFACGGMVRLKERIRIPALAVCITVALATHVASLLAIAAASRA